LSAGDDEPRILTSPAGYELRISVDDDVDAARFDALVGRAERDASNGRPDDAADALREALALWRGPALGDLAELDFARPEAVRLDELRLAALDARIDADLRCGRHAQLTGELEALCATHPLHEGLWAHRMVALYRCGRQTEALRAYQDLRSVLREEVGLEPTPALVRLEASIVTGELAVAPDQLVVATPRPTAMDTRPRRDDRSPTFVGRTDELAALDAAWASVRAGERHTVLLHGDPGAGKTTLAEQAAEAAARDGAVVLWGSFDEEMLLPFQGFVEAVRQLWAQEAQERREQPEWSALEHILPAVAPTARTAATGHGAGELERYRVLSAIEILLDQAAAIRPVVLVLDDLHWADAPSLVLLKQLARSRSAAPLLIIGTYRDTELHEEHPLLAALASLHRARSVADLGVGSLQLGDIAELVEARLGTGETEAEAIANAVIARTDGHALFSEALVEAMADPRLDPVSRQALDVPTTVHQFVASSVSRLSRPARTMLAVGAACGTLFELATALRATNLDEDAAIDGLEECTRTRFLAETDTAGVVRFTHGLVRDVVYQGLPHLRRAHLHQAVADAIDARYAGDASRSAEIARHLGLAPAERDNLRRRLDHARAAGTDSMRRVAYEAAAEQFLDALAAHHKLDGEPEEGAELRILAAQPLVFTGEAARATELCHEALGLARVLGDPMLLARAALVLEEASWTGYGFAAPATASAIERVLRDAVAATEGIDTPRMVELRGQLLARLPRVQHFGTSPQDRLPAAEASLQIAEAIGSPQLRGAALEGMRWALWGDGDVERLADVSERILDEARLAGDRALEVRANVWRYLSRLDLGDLAGVHESISALRALGTALPEPLALWYPEVAETTLALLAGRVDDAEIAAMTALGVARRFELTWAVESFGIQLQQIRREQGRLAELEDATRAVAATHQGEPVWQLAVADLDLQLGRRDAARSQLAEVVGVIGDLPRDLTWLAAVALAAELCADVADESSAAVIYPLLLPHADRIVVIGPGVACLGSAARQAGALASLLGLGEAAAALFDLAEERNLALGATPWLARTHLARAAALARQGQAAPAAACLAAARQLAKDLGAAQILTSCDLVEAG
jgi:DNA-binding SARP family transcriptional activator